MNVILDRSQISKNVVLSRSAGENHRDPQKRCTQPASVNADQKTVKSWCHLSLSPPHPPAPAPRMKKDRFAVGLLLSSAGIGVLLMVAIGMLQQLGASGQYSLPVIVITAVVGIMMLGGGFGLMATASGSFDDGEFECLMEAGNISSVIQERSGFSDSSLDAEERFDVPAGSRSEQRHAGKI